MFNLAKSGAPTEIGRVESAPLAGELLYFDHKNGKLFRFDPLIAAKCQLNLPLEFSAGALEHSPAKCFLILASNSLSNYHEQSFKGAHMQNSL